MLNEAALFGTSKLQPQEVIQFEVVHLTCKISECGTMMQDQIVSPSLVPGIEDPCASLRRASRALSHFYDQVLSPTGLKASQFIVLHAIGLRTEIAQWRLSAEYGISNDTLSRRLSVLRRKGLITCRIGSDHPGERLYRLTSIGIETLRNALPYWERAQQRLRHAIGDRAEWNSLLEDIDRICAFARLAEHGRFTNTIPSKARAAAATEAS